MCSPALAENSLLARAHLLLGLALRAPPEVDRHKHHLIFDHDHDHAHPRVLINDMVSTVMMMISSLVMITDQ